LLPQGYAEQIGDDGTRLYGCQQLRLLARMLLHEQSFLILNEAAATAYPAGRRALIADCSDLPTQNTVILITHRPALANRVLRIED
jgi:ABC-type bacteriocin/lantibiotic exporter with double-glycine peptidase domain